MSTHRRALYTVPPPNRRTRSVETVVPYHPYFGSLIEGLYGRRPSRTSLTNYLHEGYPVARGGPRVSVPVFTGLKRPMTTVEAMDRFVTTIRALERGDTPAPAKPARPRGRRATPSRN